MTTDVDEKIKTYVIPKHLYRYRSLANFEREIEIDPDGLCLLLEIWSHERSNGGILFNKQIAERKS